MRCRVPREVESYLIKVVSMSLATQSNSCPSLSLAGGTLSHVVQLPQGRGVALGPGLGAGGAVQGKVLSLPFRS